MAEKLGYKAIAAELNRDLVLNPPPAPVDPSRAVGQWTESSVREVIINPKYTGYMVFNREATKTDSGKLNPPEKWVWSAEPSHEAIVSLDIWTSAQSINKKRQRSRIEDGNSHPDTQRTYLLRSYIRCHLCGRLMGGKDSRGNTYYVCRPGRGRIPEGHPKSIWVREEPFIQGISDFFAAHIFGPNRALLLKDVLDQAALAATREHAEQLARLQAHIDDLDARRARLMRRLEDPDCSGEFAREIDARTTQLAQDRRAKAAELRNLNNQQPPTQNPELLDFVPQVRVGLTAMPEAVLRQLYDAFNLEIIYDHITDRAEITLTMTAETTPTIQRATHTAIRTTQSDQNAETPEKTPGLRGFGWYPQRDSNPCYRLERAAS